MELLFSLSFYIPFLFQELCFIHDLSAFRLSELAHLSGCCAVDEWIKSQGYIDINHWFYLIVNYGVNILKFRRKNQQELVSLVIYFVYCFYFKDSSLIFLDFNSSLNNLS